MSKTTICNWVSSQVSDLVLKDYQEQGLLPAQEEIGWRAGQGDDIPKPGEGEVVVFIDHLLGGFSPPGSKFFRDFLNFSTFILKTLLQTAFPICANFKSSVRFTCKWNPLLLFSMNSSISTAKQSLLMAPI